MVNETSCLDENDVSDLLADALGATERAAIDEHLDRCPACRSLVSSVAMALQEHDDLGRSVVRDPSLIQPIASLRRGDSLGRYVVLDVVGIGNMGVVYAAYDPDLDRRIAVKVLHEQADRHRELAWREAKSMARINHPHIVAVHDVGLAANRVFVAMEFVEGVTLRTWQNEEGHGWREVVARYLDAARGLSAAHDAGIVHRDFKPDNVLVGSDGRVRVSDLGLAAVTNLSTTSDGDPDLTGGVGTPRYMAPELHAGDPATPKSDQFAFCVALYEALYREHPFDGHSGAELAESTEAGRVRSAPTGSAVPLALRRTLLVGLAPDPRSRHADMASLIEALRSMRHRRRTPTAVALGLATVAIGYAVVERDDEPACVQQDLTTVWNDEVRGRLGEHLSRANLPQETPLLRLDEFAASWSAVHYETCLATRERRTRTTADLELSGACLEQRRIELEALVEVFEGRPQGTDELLVAIESLRAPSRCRDVEALKIEGTAPASRHRRQLARAEALVRTGDHEGGLAIATTVLESAHAERDHASEAAALLVAAWADLYAGRAVSAEERLHETLAHAEQAAVPSLRWRAMVLLVFAVGYQQSRYDEGERWAELAEALTDRAGVDEMEQARLLRYRAIIASERGRYEKAESLLRDVLTRIERADRTDHPLYSKTHLELGRTLLGLTRVEEAEAAFRRGLERDLRRLGPDHPDVANAAHGLGDALDRLERPFDARQAFAQALRIYRLRYGDRDHRSAGVQLALARLELDARTDVEAAERAVAAAKNGLEASGRAKTPLYMKTLVAQARLRLWQERADDAITAYADALELGDTIHPEHPYLDAVRYELGRLLRRQGNPKRARPLLETSLAAAQSDPERRRELRVSTLIELGQLEIDLGAADSASAYLDRASALADHPDVEASVREELEQARARLPPPARPG